MMGNPPLVPPGRRATIHAPANINAATNHPFEENPMSHRPPGRLARVASAIALAALLSPTLSQAGEQEDRLRTRALASTCAHCHGTDGRAVQGQPLVHLAGLPQDYILTQLMAFRSGQRPATIMHQITKGYSLEQLETLAKYFAAQK